MNNPATEIETWLIEGSLEPEQSMSMDIWVASFDVERQVIYSRLGPYRKLFLRPEKFVKRFYHTVYPLLIEDWMLCEQVQLFDGFCTIDTQLDIRFQASLEYAQSQIEILSEINEHIKQTYHTLVIDLLNNELQNLQNDSWVRNGLGDIEKAIVNAISEMLILENIQSQTVCIMSAAFAEFPEVQLGKEAIYLSVLKKSYEVTEQNREELFYQQQQEQAQHLQHKQKELENFEKNAELERKKQAQSAEHQSQLLQDQQQQQQQQLEIEARLHSDRVAHETQLKDISLRAESQQKQQQAKQARMAEQQFQTEQIAHQSVLKEQKIQAEITADELEHTRSLAAKAKQDELQLQYESRKDKIKFEHDIAAKQHKEKLRMDMQEKNYQMMKNSDIYLRREIELMELDKKRMALQIDIQNSKKKNNKSVE